MMEDVGGLTPCPKAGLRRASVVLAFSPWLVLGACAPGDATPPDVTFVEAQGFATAAPGPTPAQGPVLPAPTAGEGIAGAAGVAPGPVAGEAPPLAGSDALPPAGSDAPPLAGSDAPPGADAGAGDASAPVEEPPVPLGPKPTKLVVEVTTKDLGGMWGPLNAGAIWVEDPAGNWVHTLEYWTGFLNVRHLAEYVPAVSQGAPAPGLFGFPAPVDTIGRATLQVHETHRLTWGLKDANGSEVPDGMYKLIIEVTEEENDPGQILVIDIEKGPAPMSQMPPDTPYFAGMSISLE